MMEEVDQMITFNRAAPICLFILQSAVCTASSSAMDASCGHYARTLTIDEMKKLEKDSCVLSNFKQLKLEREAEKNWDLFYKRNTTKFFKDRHWTMREFHELCDSTFTEVDSIKRTLFEVGCGVGNFIFPLIESNCNFFINACDFSKRAVEFVKANPLYDPAICNVFQCDITKDDLSKYIQKETVDIVSFVFILSSLHPDTFVFALQNVLKVLKPGGTVLFRDYGRYDQAMIRFAPGQKLMDNFYVRQDGTRVYFFSEEDVNVLFSKAGFKVVLNRYIQRQTVNKKEGITVPRIYVQGKFVKAL